MSEQITGWSVQHESGEIHFLLDGLDRYTWSGNPQLSREHIAMITGAYEKGRKDAGGVTAETIAAWAGRAEEIAADLGGLSCELEGALEDMGAGEDG